MRCGRGSSRLVQLLLTFCAAGLLLLLASHMLDPPGGGVFNVSRSANHIESSNAPGEPLGYTAVFKSPGKASDGGDAPPDAAAGAEAEVGAGAGAAAAAAAAVAAKAGNVLRWCRPQSFLNPPRPPVALASFPGSGNTWLRYLIQQATGVYTGSVDPDSHLMKNGYPAEGVMNGSVAVVKTHYAGVEGLSHFKGAVLLVRAPAAAILAEFNRRNSGGRLGDHVGIAPQKAYRRNGGKYWQNFVYGRTLTWRAFNLDWARDFPGPVLVVHYDSLLNDTAASLRRVCNFLDLQVSEDDLRCALENSQGLFRRPKPKVPIDPYTPAMKKALANEQEAVFAALRRARPSEDGRLFEPRPSTGPALSPT